MTLDARTIETLSAISTATITTVLLKQGLRKVWMRGPGPLRDAQRQVVGTGLPAWCQGAAAPGLYPPNAENTARCEAFRAAQLAGKTSG